MEAFRFVSISEVNIINSIVEKKILCEEEIMDG
jgi:hypothetical protein